MLDDLFDPKVSLARSLATNLKTRVDNVKNGLLGALSEVVAAQATLADAQQAEALQQIPVGTLQAMAAYRERMIGEVAADIQARVQHDSALQNRVRELLQAITPPNAT